MHTAQHKLVLFGEITCEGYEHQPTQYLISSGFWDITQRVIFVGRRFGTSRFHHLGRNDHREYWDGVGGERFIGAGVGGDYGRNELAWNLGQTSTCVQGLRKTTTPIRLTGFWAELLNPERPEYEGVLPTGAR